jgi:hypothetical protein
MNLQQLTIARDHMLPVTAPDDHGTMVQGHIERLGFNPSHQLSDVYVRIEDGHLLRYNDGEKITLVQELPEKLGKFIRMGPHKEAKHECTLPTEGFTRKTVWECPCGQQWIATREPDSGWKVKWRKKWWRVQILKTWNEPSKPVGKILSMTTTIDGFETHVEITDPDMARKIKDGAIEALSIDGDLGYAYDRGLEERWGLLTSSGTCATARNKDVS